MMECWTKTTTEILGLIWAKLRTESPFEEEGAEKAAAPRCPPVSQCQVQSPSEKMGGGRGENAQQQPLENYFDQSDVRVLQSW